MIVAFDIDNTLLTNGNQCITTLIRFLKSFHANKNTKKVIIVTARLASFHNKTVEQLTKCKVDKYVDLQNDIFYSNHGSKLQILIEQRVDVFVDDLKKNIVEVQNARSKGLLPSNFKIYQVIYTDKNTFVPIEIIG